LKECISQSFDGTKSFRGNESGPGSGSLLDSRNLRVQKSVFCSITRRPRYLPSPFPVCLSDHAAIKHHQAPSTIMRVPQEPFPSFSLVMLQAYPTLAPLLFPPNVEEGYDDDTQSWTTDGFEVESQPSNDDFMVGSCSMERNRTLMRFRDSLRWTTAAASPTGDPSSTM
jgi:hypothetical protein